MTDQAIVPVQNDRFLAPAADLATIKRMYQAKKDFISDILNQGVDYGKVPGSDKPALFKAGAEKMTSFFGLSPTFDDVEKIEDWTGEQHGGEPLFYYRTRCTLSVTGRVIGSADGSCNSWEKKYRYRQGERICPTCGKPTIIKGKAEYGGGWVCFAKKGGCGAKFSDGDQAIEGQSVGQVKNPDVFEQVNTILKMSQKRALVAATLIATGLSEYFTQDIDDYVAEGEYTTNYEQQEQHTSQPQHPARKVSGSFNPVQTLVDAGISENNAAAASLLNKYVPANIRTDKDALLKWGKYYRGWRDLGAEPEGAAENATNGIEPIN